jgi:two-component system LytT family response regulator
VTISNTPVKTLRVAIVDDEMPARQILREYLSAEPAVEVVAECANGFDAVKAVAERAPDLLLLDVQMPKLDGFEVLDLVGAETAVIFTTAYDEYALRAFEVHAIDYLLKPFSHERLHQALARARERLDRPALRLADARSGPAAPVKPAALAAAARPPGSWLSRIVIRDGADVHVVPIDKVDYVEAQDDYIGVRTAERTLLKDQALGDLERQLDPRRFVRIHRSYLLNLDRLVRLEAAGGDSRVAVLRDGSRLPVSRSGYGRLQQLL